MSDAPHEPAAGFRHLFEPFELGGLTLRNRIVNTAHGTGLTQERDLRYLQERARGGAGFLAIVADVGWRGFAVGPGMRVRGTTEWDRLPLSPATPEGIEYYDELVIPGLQRKAAIVHAEGAHCYGQLMIPGPVAGSPIVMHPVVGPSNVVDPYYAMVPHALDDHEIEQAIETFAQGARRVQAAGLDAVEIHACHGGLVHAFLSPYFNTRTDAWGGSVEKRATFALRIIAAARELVGPTFPIGIRIGAHSETFARGMTLEHLSGTAEILAPHVAFISISNGSTTGFGDGYEAAYTSPWYKEPAFSAPTAAAVRKVVQVPVMVTSSISDPSIAESILADGAADLVGMVRALIADPQLPNKVRAGKAGEVRMCIGLNECHYHGPRRVAMTCAINASAGREDEMAIVAAEVKKEIAVIGAGPAGLEAARVAALRGHHVYLCDSARLLGGTVRVLSMDPNRRNLRDQAAYFETQLPELGVELLLGQTVDADVLAEFGLDAVIVATGGTPRIPAVPGIHEPNVVTAFDVLRGTHSVGARALVVGGHDDHLGAPTIAEFLADRGHEVEMVSERFDFANGAEDPTRLMSLNRLKNKDVKISLLTRLIGVKDGNAETQDTFTQAKRITEDVTIVLACGQVPNDQLGRDLAGKVPEVIVVGDALAPRRIMHATYEGARAALAL